ncbi:MAG: hypothetical protein ACJ70P_00245 [Nitrososphaera sp.]
MSTSSRENALNLEIYTYSHYVHIGLFDCAFILSYWAHDIGLNYGTADLFFVGYCISKRLTLPIKGNRIITTTTVILLAI